MVMSLRSLGFPMRNLREYIPSICGRLISYQYDLSLTMYSVGNLRLNLPRPNLPYKGSYNATVFGPSCPQQNETLPSLTALSPNATAFIGELLTMLSPTNAQSEDCELLSLVRHCTTY